MTELGDDFRAMKERRRLFRRHFHSCPTCAIAFGTGTKVEPGQKCHNCDWVAPTYSHLTGKPWRDR